MVVSGVACASRVDVAGARRRPTQASAATSTPGITKNHGKRGKGGIASTAWKFSTLSLMVAIIGLNSPTMVGHWAENSCRPGKSARSPPPST